MLLSAELYCYRKKNPLDFLFEKYKFSLLLFSSIIIRKLDFLKKANITAFLDNREITMHFDVFSLHTFNLLF